MLDKETIQQQVEGLLDEMQPGVSRISPAAYDTAWLARLSVRLPGYGFEGAVDWLRANQHADGSWGASIMHYHDRIMSTLAAVIALHEAGDPEADGSRIRRGERFIQENYRNTTSDYHDTVGYPIIVPRLAWQARQHGLDVPEALEKMPEAAEAKMHLLYEEPARIKTSSTLFSLEAFLPDIYYFDPELDLVDETGSVAGSPSATAANLLFMPQPDERSIALLQSLMDQLGEPALPAAMMEFAEFSFALEVLLDSGTIDEDHPAVRRLADYMIRYWNPEVGISFYPGYPVGDLDDNTTIYPLLRMAGYDVSADVFQAYEGDDHFICYAGEIDPSLMVNVRMLKALQYAGQHPDRERWVEKVRAMLRREHQRQPHFWTDKWHTSPFYVVNKVVQTLAGDMNEVLVDHIDWLLQNQHADGGWGFFNSTSEETAYALLALIRWDEVVEPVDPDVIHAGAAYLLRSYWVDEDTPRQWICKAVYRPYFIVQAVLLSALHRYDQYVKYHEDENVSVSN